jgi:hypothetical protein
MVKKEYIQHEMTVQLLSMNTSCEIVVFYSQLRLTLKKLYKMDKSSYDFRIQCAEIDKGDKILQTVKPL